MIENSPLLSVLLPNPLNQSPTLAAVSCTYALVSGAPSTPITAPGDLNQLDAPHREIRLHFLAPPATPSLVPIQLQHARKIHRGELATHLLHKLKRRHGALYAPYTFRLISGQRS